MGLFTYLQLEYIGVITHLLLLYNFLLSCWDIQVGFSMQDFLMDLRKTTVNVSIDIATV